jgi:hypothetical protein
MARLCMRCQEAADRDRQEGSDLLCDSRSKAARVSGQAEPAGEWPAIGPDAELAPVPKLAPNG